MNYQPFTDDDLKRLKENADGRAHFISTELVIALLARLDAAEEVCIADPKNDLEYLAAKHAWRKAAGK